MDVSIGDRELEILDTLWKAGPGTVADVRERLPDPLAYNTVLTILRNLEAKGLVGHTAQGRTHEYHAVVEQSRVQQTLVSRLVTALFRGSPVDLLAHLVQNETMTAAELEELHRLLDDRLTATREMPKESKAARPTRKRSS
ncbi:MAG TPA: BlaI/MecI/CopY family transcriptional regulator [Gemmatimonas sp.]|nr:BlaI/MecI/CopY family transcriptional regulator [Gemmatimonas sp.]